MVMWDFYLKDLDLVVNGFEHYVLHRVAKKKSSKRDSGGIVVNVTNSLNKHVILVKTDKDDQIWLCISGDILSSMSQHNYV